MQVIIKKITLGLFIAKFAKKKCYGRKISYN